MPLDDSTRRLQVLLAAELRRLAEREEQRGARGEEVKYDSVARLATYETRRGDVLARVYGEPIATYVERDRLLRWGWAGRASSARPSHVERVFLEAQQHGAPQLARSIVADLEPEDAEALARLAAVLCGAEGLVARRTEREVQFVGLFASAGPAEPVELDASVGRYSVPPPPVGERARETPPPAAYRSLPPIREVWEPRGGPGGREERPLREPARAVFLPVANAALATLALSCPGYAQGLFAVTIDPELGSADRKRRFLVQLVVLDASGALRALDPPARLVDAVAEMIEADWRDGNGPWRKLSSAGPAQAGRRGDASRRRALTCKVRPDEEPLHPRRPARHLRPRARRVLVEEAAAARPADARRRRG